MEVGVGVGLGVGLGVGVGVGVGVGGQESAPKVCVSVLAKLPPSIKVSPFQVTL